MKFIATLNTLTEEGASALRASINPPMHRIIRQGLIKSGIKQSQAIVHEDPLLVLPLVVEWSFTMTGVSKYAFGTGEKGFQWWQEQFEDKLTNFDKAEGVQRNKDYTLTWRKE